MKRSRKIRFWLKRAIDVGLCIILAPLALPILILFAILIKLDGGPIFFNTTRIGKNRKNFSAYKFRSMIVNADDYLDEQGRPTRERVTWVGKIIRRLSIDELPQIINIVKGEMSFIGPRPILPEHAESMDRQYEARFDVSPGISGLAQVSGRNTLPWDERFRLDVFYVENYSLWLDVKIFFKTIFVVLAGSGVVLDRNPDQVRSK